MTLLAGYQMNVENYTLANIVDVTDCSVGHVFFHNSFNIFCFIVVHREMKKFIVTCFGEYSYYLCMSLACMQTLD